MSAKLLDDFEMMKNDESITIRLISFFFNFTGAANASLLACVL